MFNEKDTVEKYFLKKLNELNYESVVPNKFRDGEDDYILDSILKDSLKKINNIDDTDAESILEDVKKISKNKEFFDVYKNGFSCKMRGVSEQTKTYHLVDFENIENNSFHYISQFSFKSNEKHIIPDIVLFINGIPFSVVELKINTTEEGRDYRSAHRQINRYENKAEELFIPNCFNIISDGNTSKYGATFSDLKYYSYFKDENGHGGIDYFIDNLLSKKMVCDVINNFIVFEEKQDGYIKKIARYQQIRAVNKIVDQVINNKEKRGLIWHTQGSGKTLTMLFTAQKLRFIEKLNNPKVFIFVDRTDLNRQMNSDFISHGGKNVTEATSINDLNKKIKSDEKGIFVTTIQKLSDGRSSEISNDADNIILLIDEAHREKGKLGNITANSEAVKKYFPNAKLYGFTGTPINKKEINTFRDYGGKVDPYLDKYSIKQAIDDGSVLNILFEQRLKHRFFINKEVIDYNFEEETIGYAEEEKEKMKKSIATAKAFFENEDRMKDIVNDVKKHFDEFIRTSGHKGQFVCYSRKIAVKYKKIFDEIFKKGEVEVIFSENPEDSDYLQQHYHKDEGNVVENFKTKGKLPNILIVVDKLLTGFDAPIEKVIYLDKFLKDHKFLQAIARTNRLDDDRKVNGLVIDYCGVTKDLKNTLEFNEEDIDSALKSIIDEKQDFFNKLNETLNIFKNIDINDNKLSTLDRHLVYLYKNLEKKETFFQNMSHLNGIYGLIKYEADVEERRYELIWLTKIYTAYKNTYEPIDEEQMKTKDKLENMVGDNITTELGQKVKNILSLSELLDEAEIKKEGSQKSLIEDIRNLKSIISTVEYNPEFECLSKMLEKIRDSLKGDGVGDESIKNDIKILKGKIDAIKQEYKKTGLSDVENDILSSIISLLDSKEINYKESDIIKFVRELYKKISKDIEKGWQNTTLLESIEKDIKKEVDEFVLERYSNIFSSIEKKKLDYVRGEIRGQFVKNLKRK